MVRLAFSTVACPEWTLPEVASAAQRWGYQGVELRSFGWADTRLACEPGLTGGEKARRLFGEVGVEIAGIATGCRFDAPIFPPVLGYISPERDRSIIEAKRYIEIAHGMGAGAVRVFGFEPAGRENRDRFRERVASRLNMVADAARNMDMVVLLENGGAFPTAADLLDMIERVHRPQLAACYSIAPAVAAGEDPVEGVRKLGLRLHTARVKDTRDGRPVPLGEGDLPVGEFIKAVRDARSARWLTVEWDRLWLPEIGDAERALRHAADFVYPKLAWSPGARPSSAAAGSAA